MKGDRGENIEQAIACYRDALQVLTQEALPQYWAMTKNGLGAAYSSPFAHLKSVKHNKSDRAQSP